MSSRLFVGELDTDPQRKVVYSELAAAGTAPEEVAFSALDTWTHVHNRDGYPDVLCVDSAGRQLRGEDVDYVDRNTVTVRFNTPLTGIMRIK